MQRNKKIRKCISGKECVPAVASLGSEDEPARQENHQEDNHHEQQGTTQNHQDRFADRFTKDTLLSSSGISDIDVDAWLLR